MSIRDRRTGLNIALDKANKMTYDEQRRAIRASNDIVLNRICRDLHRSVHTILPKTSRSLATYEKAIGSALGTFRGARRQSAHCDTAEIEDVSVLFAMIGSF